MPQNLDLLRAESYAITARFAIDRAITGPYPEANTQEAAVYARQAFHYAGKVMDATARKAGA